MQRKTGQRLRRRVTSSAPLRYRRTPCTGSWTSTHAKLSVGKGQRKKFPWEPTGEGTGLGLSIAYDIVTQQHGGTIEADSRVGEFTEFTIRLPRPPAGGTVMKYSEDPEAA